MKNNQRFVLALTHVALTGVALLKVSPTAVRAQGQAPASTTRSTTRAARAATRQTRPLEAALRLMSRETGLVVVADAPLAQAPVPVVQAAAATADNLEERLDLLVKALPRGTRWMRLLLPPAPTGRAFRGEDLADFALAQVRLFGKVGGTTPAGAIEVLGQKVTGEKAERVQDALNLQPVYLVVHPGLRTAREASSVQDLAAMTPEQRQEWAKRQAQELAAMDPQDRAQAMTRVIQQTGLVFAKLVSSLSPEEAAQLIHDMGGWTNGTDGSVTVAPNSAEGSGDNGASDGTNGGPR